MRSAFIFIRDDELHKKKKNFHTFGINHYRFEEPIMKILYGPKNGLHAFGYNSAESEPIWMKSGTV